MRMYDLITKKKQGKPLTKEEINYMISGYMDGSIPDYQMSAMMMAIYFQKMSEEETLNLTLAMANSGDIIDWGAFSEKIADKHSTGGVGDKTSLVLAPLVSSLGVHIAKMSGRGLGHTGGTIDKMESFQGFSVELSEDKFIENVNKIKMSIIGQTENLAPADKKLYALRDVTATVDNISLIASSIMSKKLAAGAGTIVLDVKTGSGAFMKTQKDAMALAKEMVKIGNGAKRHTTAVISDMNQPLGFAVGNILEVKEAIDTLNGNGPADLVDLVVTLGTYMLLGTGNAKDEADARKKLYGALKDKSGLNQLAEFIKAQGGSAKAVFDTSLFEKAKIIKAVPAPRSGFISKIEADEVGAASLILGGGRETKESAIDLAVGIILKKKVSDKVSKGETLAYIHAQTVDKYNEAKERLLNAYEFLDIRPVSQKLIYAVIDK